VQQLKRALRRILMKKPFTSAVKPLSAANDTDPATETLLQFSFGAAVKKDAASTPNTSQPAARHKKAAGPKA